MKTDTRVKMLDDASARVGGYLAVWGDSETLDLYDEYFTLKTDFKLDWYNLRPMLYQHGLDGVIKTDPVGVIDKVQPDEVGLWAEAQLQIHNEYIEAILNLVKRGVLHWSSGALPHMVNVAVDGEIKRWPLVEGSLTPTPAEPRRTNVQLVKTAYKSLGLAVPDGIDEPDKIDSESSEASSETVPEAELSAATVSNSAGETHSSIEFKHMETVTMSAPTQENTAIQAIEAKFAQQQAATQAKLDHLTKLIEDSPRVSNSGYVTQDGGTADAQIKNLGDMLMAMKRGDRERLKSVYGMKAQTEGDGTTGGFLLEEEQLGLLGLDLSLNSGITELVTEIPVSRPSGRAPIRDYSITPTAAGQSAGSSGVSGKRRKEGGTHQETTLRFEMLRYEVSNVVSGYLPASYEMIEDAPMIEGAIKLAIEEDVASKKEYFVLRGSGAGEPLGVLNWGGTIEIEEDTDNTFAVADSDEMVSRFLQGRTSRAAWAHHPGVYTDIAGFERGTGAVSLQQNMSLALPTGLHGYARYNSQHLPAQGTTGYVVLGDWSKYILFLRGGLYIRYSEHRYIDEGDVAWFFGQRMDGKPAMTSAVTLADGSFTQSPFVVLKNKA